MRNLQASTFAAGLAIVAMVGGACGGSSNTANSAVTIGVTAPLTSNRAAVGAGMVLGANIAVDSINAAGGVLGHHLNLAVQDDAADPVDAVPATQKLIQSDQVVALVNNGLVAGVELPLADKANIPDMEWGGGSEWDTVTDPHFFRLSPSDTEASDVMMIYAHSKGWNNVALAFGTANSDQALVPGILSSGKSLGMTITANVSFATGATSFRSEIQRLYAGHPQAILSQLDVASFGVVFGELKQQGLLTTPWVVSEIGAAKDFFGSVTAGVATGPIYVTEPSSQGSLGSAPFLSLLQKKTGSAQPNSGNEPIYDAVITWALGADQAGTWNWPAVGKGIEAASNGPGTACGDYATCYALIKAGKPIDWEGSSSTVDFDKYHNVFGPFDVLHYNSDGTRSILLTYTPKDVEAALAGS
jgi:branched-chain amino acid transport system substrate-binding protein